MSEMVDVVYALEGDSLPAEHASLLWREVVRVLPWLGSVPEAGILPLRPPGQDDDLLLSRRARMVLRIPADHVDQALQLTGQTLDVGGHAIKVGEGKPRPLQATPTLHAQLVASELPEAAFVEAMTIALQDLGIAGKLICGKHHVLSGSGGKIAGYSLVVHELKPEASLQLQCCGLGGERHLGCGMFIPYKVIANLDGQTG